MGKSHAYRMFGETSADTEGFIYKDGQATLIGQLSEQFEYSVAFGINNNDQVVGEAQVSHAQQTSGNNFVEGRHGVLFENGTLYDLNDLIKVFENGSCKSDYQIISAQDINDSGQIAATALVEYTDPITNTDGYRAVAVRLDPIPGGTIESCEDTTPGKKKSGSTFWLVPLLLLGLLTQRRWVRCG